MATTSTTTSTTLTNFHTNDALGIILELMDLIGSTITLTWIPRWVQRFDEDAMWWDPVERTVTGELLDVRATQKFSTLIRVTLVTGEDERVAHTTEVLLRAEGAAFASATPYRVTVG